MNRPILYSFRRCPYAIRARMALAYSGVGVELREVVLKDKPECMLQRSSKGTVPVMVLQNGQVIDESLDVMKWALKQCDHEDWLNKIDVDLLEQNDGEFKYWLDRYKYADRYPQQPLDFYKEKAGVFIKQLDNRLKQHAFLLGKRPGFADIALFPFVRQFAFVDKGSFDRSVTPGLQRWLSHWLASPLFLSIMHKYSQWEKNDNPIYVDWDKN